MICSVGGEQRQSRAASRRWFIVTVLVYMAFNAIASAIGLVAKLPDLPATHAHSDHITLAQVSFTDGTIMSPPLVAMLVVALLLWGAVARNLVLQRICTALLVLGVGTTVVDEAIGFSSRPALYSSAKWGLALAIGTIFVVVGAAVVVSGAVWLYTGFRADGPR
jgi:hypothetical protein